MHHIFIYFVNYTPFYTSKEQEQSNLENDILYDCFVIQNTAGFCNIPAVNNHLLFKC